jgi:hypothetical protein
MSAFFFVADDHLYFAVMLDLKGTQFTGKLFPGPTALLLAVTTSSTVDGNPYLKVEGITDEFCSLVKTGDAMAKMNAAVQRGMCADHYYHYEDEDVNRTTGARTDTATADVAAAGATATTTLAAAAAAAVPKKRKRSAQTAATRKKKSKR